MQDRTSDKQATNKQPEQPEQANKYRQKKLLDEMEKANSKRASKSWF